MEEKMIFNKHHYFDDKKYEEDVLEFSHKNLDYWKKITADNVNEYKEIVRRKQEYTRLELMALYNHPLINAKGYANGVHPLYDIDPHLNSPSRKWMRLFKNEFKDNMRMLDFGCGDLTNCIVFHDMGYRVTAVDLPIEWIRFIEYRCKKYGVDINFKYTYNDDNFLNDGEMFDCMFSHEVMEHIDNPEKAMAYLVSHLKVDGKFYLTGNFDTGGGFHLKRNWEKFGKNRNRNSVEWIDFLKSIGLEQIEENLFIKVQK